MKNFMHRPMPYLGLCLQAGPGATFRPVSNSFGQNFRINHLGRKPRASRGVVIDGCPARLPLATEEIQADLDRRRPGQSDITTPRKEADKS